MSKDRDEDSGLHDIRNLAAASRQRLSSRRIGTNPPPVDEDVLASTSGSWKSIALPEPAKMVSLPDIADLPSKADLKAAQKAEKLAAKADAKARKSRPSGEMSAIEAAAAPLAVVPQADVNAKVSEAPLHLEDNIPSISSDTAKGATTAAIGTAKGAAASTVTPMFGARISGVQGQKSKAPLFAMVGLGLAAAAGAVVYVATRGGDDKPTTVASEPARDNTAAAGAPVAETKPVVEPIKEDPAPPAPAAAIEEPKPDPVPVEPPTTAKTVKPAKPSVTKKPAKTTIEVDDPGNGVKPPVKKEEPKKEEPKKEGDPDFEQLLKESGYQKKEDQKPKLEKKSLSGGDFKTGMSAVAGRAQGCYKGTQGTASVKLTIAPNGSVSKVHVSGVGAAEASCVEAAVRAATFPPWDGGPQSFGYTYLLSE